MTTLRHCDLGGVLVSARGRLPTDRCEYNLIALQAPCGCNQLRCGNCGEMVRSGLPGLGLTLESPLTPAALYAAERWEGLPGTTASAESRLYACCCSLWECRNDTQSIDREHDTPTAPQMEWSCVGHPAPELPLRLGDLDIADDADWADIVDRILDGACPRPLGTTGVSREGPSIWLGWLYVYLAGLHAADTLSSALADRFLRARADARGAVSADPDLLVRGRVLHVFMRFPRAAGIDRLLGHAEENIGQSAVGYPIPELWTSPTLFEVIIARLESAARVRNATDVRASELLRRVMRVPLSELSHADLGPTDPVAHQRAHLAALGEDLTSEQNAQRLAEYKQSLAAQRVDVVLNALQRGSLAFRDAELYQWIADHIVEIDAAAPGRWRALMDLLAGWYKKPALGHLIVIAGMSLVTRHAVAPADFREWMDKARFRHLWIVDAWVLPLTSVLDDEEKKLSAS